MYGGKEEMNPIQTWKSFQDRSLYYQAVQKDGEESCWQEIAQDYNRIAYPDRQQETLLARLLPRLEGVSTAIEIGAGPGTLTLPLAERLRKVTAVEPSPAMSEVLADNLAQHGLENVTLLRQRWEELDADALPPADAVLAGGCLYVFYAIDTALRKMLAVARSKVLLTHIGTEGLPKIEQRLIECLSLVKPNLFPPLSLLLEVLVHLCIPTEITLCYSTVSRRQTAEQWLQRWQRLFHLSSQQRLLLLGFLEQECRKEGEFYCTEEIVPAAIIELRKTV
ncbi:MAG: class I SAM-dependent methyltransferase [Candidatus Electrothrix sp. AW3_4]|nr:class I SAM-dependent methyltransferase [Candidatus Electrothrix gigas]